MPSSSQNGKPFDARIFVALWAGYDLGNDCEAEALSKARMMRQMAAKEGLRIVDLLERPDVVSAFDAQLQPRRRKASGDEEEASALREELLERTRDVRMLAERVQRKEEVVRELRRELALATDGPSRRSSSSLGGLNAVGGTMRSFGTPSWTFEVTAVCVVAVLLIMALFNGHFSERGNANGLGSNQGQAAPLVHKDRSVLSVPKPRSLRRRLHSSGPVNRPR